MTTPFGDVRRYLNYWLCVLSAVGPVCVNVKLFMYKYISVLIFVGFFHDFEYNILQQQRSLHHNSNVMNATADINRIPRTIITIRAQRGSSHLSGHEAIVGVILQNTKNIH